MMAVLLVMAGLIVLVVGGCGGGDSSDAGSTTTAAPSGSPGASQSAAEGEGVAVAKEILAAFDEVVGKAADLTQGNPEPAVLKPQLEELYASYEAKMAELNGKYLALRDADTAQWGACNSYLGENRGKHVFDKDNTLTEAYKHYNLEVGDREIVELLEKGPVELLEMAVKQ